MNANSLLTLSFLLVSSAAFAQSQFAVQNYSPGSGVDAPVYNWDGTALEGTDYLAELWGGAASNSLAPVVNIGLGNQREIVPFLQNGYFMSPYTLNVVPTVPPSGYAWLKVRAWDARLGDTFQEVEDLGLGGYGESSVFYAQGSNPLLPLPDLPAPLIGLQSFTLRPIIPEPTTGVLLAWGAGMVWWARRRLTRK
jgi:hypothetical protein